MDVEVSANLYVRNGYIINSVNRKDLCLKKKQLSIFEC